MKKIIINLAIMLVLITASAYPINPEYILSTGDFTLVSPKVLEFSIYLKHTNASQTTFNYAMGQYFLSFNPNFANGGTLSYTFINSNLPAGLRPQSPQVFIDELRLAANLPVDHNFTISENANNGQGTLIARMRLTTSANAFSGNSNDLNLQFKKCNRPGFYTKLYAFDDVYVRNITDSLSIIGGGTFSNVTNEIRGKVFLDENQNGLFDLGEPPYTSAYVSTNQTIYGVYANGTYSISCYQGSFNVGLINLPKYYQCSPASYNFTFPGFGQIESNKDFAVTFPANICDVTVNISTMRPRPGFDLKQYVFCENAGTMQTPATLVMKFDSHLTYMPGQTIPSPTSYDPNTKTLTWDLSSFQLAERRMIQIGYNLPANVPLGTLISSEATITPPTTDNYPSDNEFHLVEVVRGSYDPNDKTVSKIGNITPDEVADQDSLTYKIRFQNTGTDTAFNIAVVDSISSMYELSTISMVSSSHPFTYTLSPEGVLRWTFGNILLPDSTTNEPLSHGFITYRIKPKSTLVIGDTLKNRAYIYFDFNEPIITNTETTPVGHNKKYVDVKFKLEAMHPVEDSVTVSLRNAVSPFNEIASVKLKSSLSQPEFMHVVAGFDNIEPGSNFYIVVQHRNSIETWSANPVTIFFDSTEYDFTTSVDQAYGSNMSFNGSVAALFSGDVNHDDAVDLSDLIVTFNDAEVTALGYLDTDINGDNVVDLSDIIAVFNNAQDFITSVKP